MNKSALQSAFGILLLAAGLSISRAAEEPIMFLPCAKSTCEPVTESQIANLVAVEAVLSLTPSVECPSKCSTVQLGGGKTIHVFGHMMDVGCKVWGGEFCQWDRDVISRTRMLETIKKVLKGESVE